MPNTESITTFDGQAEGQVGQAEGQAAEGQALEAVLSETLGPSFASGQASEFVADLHERLDGALPENAEGQVGQAEGQAAKGKGKGKGKAADESAESVKDMINRRRREERDVMLEDLQAFSDALIAPSIASNSLVTLAAGALQGLLSRRDAPCALNPEDISQQAAAYAKATLAALSK